jgi:hypothetical protein
MASFTTIVIVGVALLVVLCIHVPFTSAAKFPAGLLEVDPINFYKLVNDTKVAVVVFNSSRKKIPSVCTLVVHLSVVAIGVATDGVRVIVGVD